MMKKKILKVKKGCVCVCVLKMFVISFNEILKFQKKKRKEKKKNEITRGTKISSKPVWRNLF